MSNKFLQRVIDENDLDDSDKTNRHTMFTIVYECKRQH